MNPVWYRYADSPAPSPLPSWWRRTRANAPLADRRRCPAPPAASRRRWAAAFWRWPWCWPTRTRWRLKALRSAACWTLRLRLRPQRLYPAGAALPSLRQYLPRNQAIRRLTSGVSGGQELCSVKQEVTLPFSPFDQHERFSVTAAIRLRTGVCRSKLVSCPTKSSWFNWRQLDVSCWTVQLSYLNILMSWVTENIRRTDPAKSSDTCKNK